MIGDGEGRIDGVPTEFTNGSSNGKTFGILKGQLNKFRLRPQILNEHAESSRVIQGVISSGNIVGQIFKASHDNINGILLTLESAAGSTIDNFESYADSAALQVEWVKTGVLEALLETTIVFSGTKSMNLRLDNLADKWTNTIPSVDYTDFIFDFDYYQDIVSGITGATVAFFIGDGTNTKSIDLTVVDINVWQHFEIDENAMAVQAEDDTASPPNMAAITQIGFRVDNKRALANSYVDDLIAIPAPGEIELKLWNMGSAIPVDAITKINDGAQFTQLGDIGINGAGVASIKLPLHGGKRVYAVNSFVAGVALEIPTNELLILNNYYIITLNYVDTNVNVYGPDSSFSIQYYNNGYAFTAPDEATAISAIGTYNDLMFGIFSTQDVYVNTIVKFFDAEPGVNATEQVLIEDENMVVTDLVVGETRPLQAIQAEFSTKPSLLVKGGKFEVYYNDDFRDTVSIASVLIGYLFEPQSVNG